MSPGAEVVPADDAGIATAVRLLTEGRLVALPTETVYGLAARADDPAALRGVFEAKGRPVTNPLIAHVLDADHARRLVADGAWGECAQRLADRFWPGPLTLVLPRRRETVPDELTGGGPTVAVRAPDHPVFRAVLAAVDFAIAAPSANPSERVSPTTAAHVATGLGSRVDLILDGGPCRLGLESTVVRCGDGEPVELLRPGAVGIDALRDVVPDIRPATTAVDPDRPAPTPAASPGQHARHYAPRAQIVLMPRRDDPGHELAASIRTASGDARARQPGARVGLLLFGPAPSGLPRNDGSAAAIAKTFELPPDPTVCAARLYATLHEVDAWRCDVLLVEAPPASDEWLAIRDRLQRAATRR